VTGAGLVLVCATLAGACTAGSTPRVADRPSPVAGTPRTSSAPSVPTTTAAAPVAGEPVLGRLSSQRGTQTLGPYPVTTGGIAVYVVCVGTGELDVSIPGVGGFPQRCSPDGGDPGVRDAFDVRGVQSVTVQGQGDDSLLWGMTVTSVPPA
jgi:hypothetical protein